MPYFINCPRCNKDNSFSVLGHNNTCSKCCGTGRDWRKDYELENYHSWAGISIENLKSKGVITITNHGNEIHFTYRNEVPECTIEEEIEEIKKELNIEEPEYISQIFCEHNWINTFASNDEVCTYCKKVRSKKTAISPDITDFKYNKDLHDNKLYFPNRCYACSEYEHTTSEHGNPRDGSDKVFCNIGGAVRADEGCTSFAPDITAECNSCWNFSRNKNGADYYCEIQGKLAAMIWDRCPYYVKKEGI